MIIGDGLASRLLRHAQNTRTVAGHTRASWTNLSPIVTGQVHGRGDSAYVQPLVASMQSATHAIEAAQLRLAGLLHQLDD